MSTAGSAAVTARTASSVQTSATTSRTDASGACARKRSSACLSRSASRPLSTTTAPSAAIAVAAASPMPDDEAVISAVLPAMRRSTILLLGLVMQGGRKDLGDDSGHEVLVEGPRGPIGHLKQHHGRDHRTQQVDVQ